MSALDATIGCNFPAHESITRFVSQFSYNCPNGKQMAVVDGTSIYYFDQCTIHPTKFRYSHRKCYADYSEYYVIGDDEKTYILFTPMAVGILIPNLIIQDSPEVIVPVQSTITLMHGIGIAKTYQISNRTPIARFHGAEK